MAPLETKVIFQAPIFHFHDYGRKANIDTKNCPYLDTKSRHQTWQQKPVKLYSERIDGDRTSQKVA